MGRAAEGRGQAAPPAWAGRRAGPAAPEGRAPRARARRAVPPLTLARLPARPARRPRRRRPGARRTGLGEGLPGGRSPGLLAKVRPQPGSVRRPRCGEETWRPFGGTTTTSAVTQLCRIVQTCTFKILPGRQEPSYRPARAPRNETAGTAARRVIKIINDNN